MKLENMVLKNEGVVKDNYQNKSLLDSHDVYGNNNYTGVEIISEEKFKDKTSIMYWM